MINGYTMHSWNQRTQRFLQNIKFLLSECKPIHNWVNTESIINCPARHFFHTSLTHFLLANWVWGGSYCQSILHHPQNGENPKGNPPHPEKCCHHESAAYAAHFFVRATTPCLLHQHQASKFSETGNTLHLHFSHEKGVLIN